MYLNKEQAIAIDRDAELRVFVSRLHPFPYPTPGNRTSKLEFLPYWNEENPNNEVKSYLSHAFGDCIDRIAECEGQVDKLRSTVYQLVILNLMKGLNVDLPFNMRDECEKERKAELEKLINNL